MATNSMSNNLRRDFFNGDVDFGADTFKCSLYSGSSHDANTGAYTATAEVANGNGYTTAGNTLSGGAIAVDTSNNVAFMDWTDTSWTTSTISSTDALIYDDSTTTPTADVSCAILDFNGAKASSSGTFLISFPSATFSTAIIRLA